MNDENKVNYYAIIPATVRYSSELKANEKLLYSEITALSNKNGYCYAQNKYFANLYNVTIHTVSQWVSHLEKLGFITTELIRNSNNEVLQRRIYINAIPYIQKNTYPYVQKNTEGIDKKVKDNIIKYNDDELFILIINKSDKISEKFYEVLKDLGFNYTQKIISHMQPDRIEMIKDITYVVYELYNSEFDFLLSKISRESLLNLYRVAKEHMPNDLLNYYKRAIINKCTNNST